MDCGYFLFKYPKYLPFLSHLGLHNDGNLLRATVVTRRWNG